MKLKVVIALFIRTVNLTLWIYTSPNVEHGSMTFLTQLTLKGVSLVFASTTSEDKSQFLPETCARLNPKPFTQDEYRHDPV